MDTASATQPTTGTLHYVCCDTAYCATAVEDHVAEGVTDIDCLACAQLAGTGVCPRCGHVFP